MEKISLPKGLIRYASEENIENKTKFKLTARMKGYIAVLTILTGVLLGMLMLRNDVEANILRLPGQLYEQKGENIISNVYTYKLVNKTSQDIENISFKIRNKEGEIKLVSNSDSFSLKAQDIAEGTLFIELNKSDLSGDKNKLTIDVYSNKKLIETTSIGFLGPRSYN